MIRKILASLMMLASLVFMISVGLKIFFPSDFAAPLPTYKPIAEQAYRQPLTLNQVDNDRREKLHIHLAMDYSLSFDLKHILAIYNQMNILFAEYDTSLYYFGATAEKYGQGWQSISEENINQTRRQMVTVGSKTMALGMKTNLLAPIRLLNEEIKQANDAGDPARHIAIIVSDDRHEPILNEDGQQETIDQLLKETQNLLEISNARYFFVRVEKLKYQFLSKHFSSVLQIVDAANLKQLAEDLEKTLTGIFYQNDLQFTKNPHTNEPISDYSDFCIQDSEQPDSTYQHNHGQLYKSPAYFQFLGSGTKPNHFKRLKLKPKLPTTYFNFTLNNQFHFFPIRVQIENITFCNPKFSMDVKTELANVKNGIFEPVQWELKPGEQLQISVPVKVDYPVDWLNSIMPWTGKTPVQPEMMVIKYRIDYLGTDRPEFEYLDRFLPPKKEKNSFFYENKHQWISMKGDSASGKTFLIYAKNPMQPKQMAIWGALLALFSLLLARTIRPSFRGWRIQIQSQDGERLYHRHFPTRRKTFSIGSDSNCEINLPDIFERHIMFRPGKTQRNWIRPIPKRDKIWLQALQGIDIIKNDDDIGQPFLGSTQLKSNARLTFLVHGDQTYKFTVY